MPSTVRLPDHAMERLRRLQDAWDRARGTRPNPEELLDRALAYLDGHPDDFLDPSVWRPLTPEEIGRLEAEFQVLSGDTGRYDIDEEVYGGSRDDTASDDA